MKITRKTVRREITLDEFIRQKSSGEYAPLRQISKSLNFLLIFGGSAKVFSEHALETAWTPEQVDEYIEANNCYQEVEDARLKYRSCEDLQIRYIAVATRLRDNFFKGYPGLMQRIERERAFVRKHGYVRSPFGATRNIIELYLMGDYDQRELAGKMHNLDNICANTSIQNDEASVTKRVMFDMQNWLRDNGYKSRIWNEIHDSIDLFVHKDELVPVLAHLKYLCERPQPEFMPTDVVLKVDCEISDLNTGHYYKGGVEPEELGIDWEHLKEA